MIIQTDINNLDANFIRGNLDKHTYAIVRGIFDANEILSLRRRIESNLDFKKDIKHDPRDLGLAKKLYKNFL